MCFFTPLTIVDLLQWTCSTHPQGKSSIGIRQPAQWELEDSLDTVIVSTNNWRAENQSGLTQQNWMYPPQTWKYSFRSCSKFKISTFLGIIMLIWDTHFFYCIFVQFMSFPVLHFGLAHSGSRPFNYYFQTKFVCCSVNVAWAIAQLKIKYYSWIVLTVSRTSVWFYHGQKYFLTHPLGSLSLSLSLQLGSILLSNTAAQLGLSSALKVVLYITQPLEFAV